MFKKREMPKGIGMGQGTVRREVREAVARMKEILRTKNAAPAKVTRQQRRRAEQPHLRRIRKMKANLRAAGLLPEGGA